MKLRSKILIVLTIVSIVVITGVRVVSWLNVEVYGFHFEIDPDEVYRISWWGQGLHLSWNTSDISGEKTDRDGIEEIVAYLNALVLIRRPPRVAQCSCSISMVINLYDEGGIRQKHIAVYSGRHLIGWGCGWHRIMCNRRPLEWFASTFE